MGNPPVGKYGETPFAPGIPRGRHAAVSPRNTAREKQDCKNEQEVPNVANTGKRVSITLACTECKQRNYNTKKNKQNDPDRLEMKKYCRFCRKHTLHRESK